MVVPGATVALAMASTEGADSKSQCALCEDDASRFASMAVNGQVQSLPVCEDCFAEIEGSKEPQSPEASLVRIDEDDED